jgi:shikimate kinase / 3-dehydroquinate synthase
MTAGIKSVYEDRLSPQHSARAAAIVAALGQRALVLVGLMGSGKSAIGRRLAQILGLEFVDSDTEVERAADMPIPEIFARYGEPYFRDGERRVMARLLTGGPRVIATGGGAFMSEETRERIRENGISVWLKADLDVLWRRVRKRNHRPLLQNDDPESVLKRLMDERYPVYAQADLAIVSQDGPHDSVVEDLLVTLHKYLCADGVEDELVSEVQEKPAIFECVNVNLGSRSYDILIGEAILTQIAAHAAALAPGAAVAIVTDENVARTHLPAVAGALAEAGIRHRSVVVAPGEDSKSYATFEKICDAIIAGRFERGDLVVALGGGVVGDLAGFAAASVRRGMRFIQVPTSLLAQVDSSVGGKTGINSPHGKNLIGAFHQPRLVLIDTQVLQTLPLREFRAGYAEVIKYGLINDRTFFEWLEDHWQGVFGGGIDQVYAIRKSCAAKAAIVAADEHEAGERALLNLGHTFAHAFERLVHYDNSRLVHGEAVAIGLACAYRFSAARGLLGVADAERVTKHLRDVGLPAQIRDIPGWNIDADAIVEAMLQDKKVQRGVLTFILARGIGEAFIARDIAAADVYAFLADELNAA